MIQFLAASHVIPAQAGNQLISVSGFYLRGKDKITTLKELAQKIRDTFFSLDLESTLA